MASGVIVVSDLVENYIVALVMATRKPERYADSNLAKWIEIGSSPRASIALDTALPRSAVQRAMGRPAKDNYSRQTWMEAHARLMGHLRPHWEARVRSHNDAVLRRFPLTPDELAHARSLDLSGFGLE